MSISVCLLLGANYWCLLLRLYKQEKASEAQRDTHTTQLCVREAREEDDAPVAEADYDPHQSGTLSLARGSAPKILPHPTHASLADCPSPQAQCCDNLVMAT